jgi:hypothetical protein
MECLCSTSFYVYVCRGETAFSPSTTEWLVRRGVAATRLKSTLLSGSDGAFPARPIFHHVKEIKFTVLYYHEPCLLKFFESDSPLAFPSLSEILSRVV